MDDRLTVGAVAPNFVFVSPGGPPRELYAAMRDGPAVLVFLRYFGCPISQMEVERLKREAGALTAKGATVIVVVQSPASTLSSAMQVAELPFEVAADPEGTIYGLYSVVAASVLRYLRPEGLFAAARALSSGFMHRRFEGKETQLPAVFFVNPDKTVRFAHYGRHIGDLPSPTVVAAVLGAPRR